MNCGDTIKCMERFVDHELSPREMEAFLDHVAECPECYEELETYYTVAVTLHYLDRNEDGNRNIPLRLREHIAQERQHLHRQKVFRYSAAAVLGVLGACLLWILFNMYIPAAQVLMKFGAQLFSGI